MTDNHRLHDCFAHGHCLRLEAVLLLLLFLSSAELSFARGLADQVVEKRLSNGLKVIFLENHKAPVATFQIWYRVGSKNESWGKTGMSHLLEHMMFKGTKGVTGEAFDTIIAENGGDNNAFTSHDFTVYFENISSDRLKIPIRLEADRMSNLRLVEGGFKTERMVVLEERRMGTEDDPQGFLMEQVNATAFQISPYHWPVIGWEGDISALTLRDLKAHYDRYYNPANAFIVVAGDFRIGEVLSVIERFFGKIKKKAAPEQKRAVDPPQTGERRVAVHRVAELPYLVMAYHVPNINHSDSYALDVLEAILGSGKSSRLYFNLVEEQQIALSVDADNSLLSMDPDLFTLAVQPVPNVDLATLEKGLDREIEQLRTKPVDEYELQKAKNQLEAAFVFGQQSLFYQAMLLAQCEIVGDWRKIDEYIPAIRRVTPDDIRRVANSYLVPRNRTVGTLIPLPKTKEGNSNEGPKEPSASEKMIR
jgi:zinc protease